MQADGVADATNGATVQRLARRRLLQITNNVISAVNFCAFRRVAASYMSL
jgi:hypothetical protein